MASASYLVLSGVLSQQDVDGDEDGGTAGAGLTHHQDGAAVGPVALVNPRAQLHQRYGVLSVSKYISESPIEVYQRYGVPSASKVNP